jgi:hypothetical protein
VWLTPKPWFAELVVADLDGPDRYSVFSSSKHKHTISSPPDLATVQLSNLASTTNSFLPAPGTLQPTPSTSTTNNPNRLDQRSNSVPSITHHPLPTARPRLEGGVLAPRPASEYPSSTVAGRRPSPTYHQTRRPSALPKPLDSTNSFGITLTDKAGKRELRSAYATQGSSIAISSDLSPDKVSLSFTTKTTIDSNGQSHTTWQIKLDPVVDYPPPLNEPVPSARSNRLNAYQLSAQPRPTSSPPSASPKSATSPLSTGLPAALPAFSVQVMEPTPRWSGSSISREENELTLARGRRRMMSKWSDTEGESDNEQDYQA